MDTDETPEEVEISVNRPPNTCATTPATMVLGVCSISGNLFKSSKIASRSLSPIPRSAQIRSAIPN